MQLFLLWNIVLSQWISKGNGLQFWPVAPRSTIGWCLLRGNGTLDWQEMSFCLQAVLHLHDRVPCILKRYGTFCRDKHAVILKKMVFLKHSINSDYMDNSMPLISHNLKECGIPSGNCGIPLCNILLQRGQRSSYKMYHYCEARPWDVHSIPLERVHHVFHIYLEQISYVFHRGTVILFQRR